LKLVLLNELNKAKQRKCYIRYNTVHILSNTLKKRTDIDNDQAEQDRKCTYIVK